MFLGERGVQSNLIFRSDVYFNMSYTLKSEKSRE